MIRALRQAMLAQLRLATVSGGCGYTDRQCDEGPPDGQPPPTAGAFWVSVHRFTRRKVQESSSEIEYTGCLTVSERIDVPWDRIGQKTIEEATLGINDRCGFIAQVMEMKQYDVMNAANTTINALASGPYDGFVEPFLTYEEGALDLVSGDWFHGETEKSAGIRKTLTFHGARRVQNLTSVVM